MGYCGSSTRVFADVKGVEVFANEKGAGKGIEDPPGGARRPRLHHL
jgi:hypothetical protein